MAEAHSFTHDTDRGGKIIYNEVDTVGDLAAAELRVVAADGS